MTHNGHTYRFTTDQGQGPVMRVWAPHPVEHPQLQACTNTPEQLVHLWFTLGPAHTPRTTEKPDHPTLTLSFEQATPDALSAMQGMVSALQCDGVQSVYTNADFPDLMTLFGGENMHAHCQVQVATAHAQTPKGAIAALGQAWNQLVRHTPGAALLIRAYAPGHARMDREVLEHWRAITSGNLHTLCWDIYDTACLPGEATYFVVTHRT